MSKTTDKINKLAIQHKAIGVKTDCKYFSNIGNLCSRVENGLMRCDEYLECEFKYIDALKEENTTLRKFLNQNQEEAEALKSYETYKVWLNNEYRKKIEKIEEIIKKLPDYYNFLDCEAKGHRAITMVEKIQQIIADQKESEVNNGTQEITT